MKIKTHLFSGIGNTFQIFYNQPLSIVNKQFINWAQLQKQSDGYVFLNKKSDYNYDWKFFNNDGSIAEMCGNASRCVGAYVNQFVQPFSEIYLTTLAGQIKIKNLNYNQFEVQMPAIQQGKSAQYFYCDTGVPHVVLEIPSDEKFDSYKEKCKEIRMSLDFQPKGTNVTLLKNKIHSAAEADAVTFERGVEDFTLGCGTGAVAAAFYLAEKYSFYKSTINMPGGSLFVDVSDKSKPKMIGQAQLIEEFEYEYVV